jgi:hypothetical protein
MSMKNFVGRVISAKYSPYYTERYGDGGLGVLGYSLHILIGHNLGEEMCLELPVYATNCYKVNGKIRKLSLISPIYNKKVGGNYVPVWDGELKIEPYLLIGIKSSGALVQKIKNDKEYKMNSGLNHCHLKQPLLTGQWVNPEYESNVVAIKPAIIKPIPMKEFTNSTDSAVLMPPPVRPLPQLLPLAN